MSVFGESDSLSNFLQTHIFWNFDNTSRIYKQISYSNIWFPKVIIILIMTAQVLFFNVFFEKDSHLNRIESLLYIQQRHIQNAFQPLSKQVISLEVTTFTKKFILDVWKGSEYVVA